MDNNKRIKKKKVILGDIFENVGTQFSYPTSNLENHKPITNLV
jgi:hypothetical protein